MKELITHIVSFVIYQNPNNHSFFYSYKVPSRCFIYYIYTPNVWDRAKPKVFVSLDIPRYEKEYFHCFKYGETEFLTLKE